MTLHDALIIGTKAIGSHETRLLLSHITGLQYAQLNSQKPLSQKAYGAFLTALNRRKASEPLQYILGTWDFYSLPFITDPRALIPRPETELLVEQALAYINKQSKPVNVLDLCTGSGCIAVAIAKLSNTRVTATDISHDALALASENAKLHSLDINFIQGDLFENLNAQQFDVIISNPPYIPSNEINQLQADIQNHEPHLALDGGIDGMDIYRRIIPQSLDFLTPGGMLFLEIGPIAVKDIMTNAGYDMISVSQDYAKLDRIISAQKSI